MKTIVFLLAILSTLCVVSAVEFIEDASVLSARQTKQEEFTADDYITDVRFTNNRCETGYQRATDDLNQGAGGDFIYMCIKKGGNAESVLTDMQVVTGDRELDVGSCPRGYQIVDQDLNKGARGKYIYLCLKYGEGVPIVNVASVAGRNAFNSCPARRLNAFSTVNLNQGTRGGPIFLCWQTHGKKVVNVKVTKMEYDLRALSQNDASVRSVDEITVRAGATETETSSLTGEYTVTQSQSWESSAGVTIGVSAEFEVGIPAVASSTVTVSKETSFSYTFGRTREESETRSYNVACKADPFTIKKCTAVYRTARISIPYVSTRIVTYADGSAEESELRGVFKGVSAGRLEIQEEVTQLPRPQTNNRNNKRRRRGRK